MFARNHLHNKCFTTSAPNSGPPSQRTVFGTPKVRHSSTTTRATPTACLVSSGNPKENFEARSPTSKVKYIVQSILSGPHGVHNGSKLSRRRRRISR
ncbi:unnamed protein product [Ectocarpus sp. CCAP 1310/34]|nr:unnamed protein product [Ectocarpus sp. CCAP 1310/34]